MSAPANGFPHALLSLNDDELSAVMCAAGGLQQADRPAFLQMLADPLALLPAVGPGSLHRCVKDLLRDMRFSRPPEQPLPRPPKHARPTRRRRRAAQYGGRSCRGLERTPSGFAGKLLSTASVYGLYEVPSIPDHDCVLEQKVFWQAKAYAKQPWSIRIKGFVHRL